MGSLYRTSSQQHLIPFYTESASYIPGPQVQRIRRFNSVPNLTVTYDNPAGKYAIKTPSRPDKDDFWYYHYSTNRYNPWPTNTYPYNWRKYTYIKSQPVIEYTYPHLTKAFAASNYLWDRNFSNPNYSYHNYSWSPSYDYDWPTSSRMFRMRYYRAASLYDYGAARNAWSYLKDVNFPSYHYGRRFYWYW